MPRVVIHEAHGPQELKVGEQSKWICRCGLSKNQPLCDGSHNKTKDEDPDTLYQYDGDDRKEVSVD